MSSKTIFIQTPNPKPQTPTTRTPQPKTQDPQTQKPQTLEHPNTWTLEPLNPWTPELLNTYPKHLNTWTLKHLNTWTPKDLNTYTPAFRHLHVHSANGSLTEGFNLSFCCVSLFIVLWSFSRCLDACMSVTFLRVSLQCVDHFWGRRRETKGRQTDSEKRQRISRPDPVRRDVILCFERFHTSIRSSLESPSGYSRDFSRVFLVIGSSTIFPE